jgi:hypothetical protein
MSSGPLVTAAHTVNCSAISSQPPLHSSAELLTLKYELTGCQSQSYVMTGGQLASLSWYKASIWGLRPDLYY